MDVVTILVIKYIFIFLFPIIKMLTNLDISYHANAHLNMNKNIDKVKEV